MYFEKNLQGRKGVRMEGRPVMLIADDVEINRTILRQIFQDQYEVHEAMNGQDALDKLTQQEVNLLLLDLVMPVMDGYEVLSYLKRHDAYAELPVLAMTQRGDSDGQARAIEMGAADFITKPFHPLIVRRRAHNVLANVENEWRKAMQAAKDHQLQEMHRSIEEDSLTGIDNRETFYRKTAELLQKNEAVPYDLIYFDIDDFRIINALFHVETGNLILKTAAFYLQAAAGGLGTCGRLEIDHFALCVPRGSIDVRMLLQGLDHTVQSLGISHNVLFYAGVYPIENIYLPIDQMIERAHFAMERVRGSHVERFYTYDHDMREQMLHEQMILRDMEFALQERQFEVWYQPIYRATTGQAVQAEALVRWQHPSEGLIEPTLFVPIFEHNGFIVRLDRYVWEEVAKFLAAEKEQYGTAMPVSVNVSRLNFYNHGLLEFLLELLRRYKLAPDLIRLEVTEQAYMENPQQIAKAIEEFRAKGFRVLMDNFGSGASSLKMLKNLPVDVLKVDMRFLHGGDEQRARAILAAIVQTAKAMDTGLIMEGVETKEEVDFLTSIGCDAMQGYYYAWPMPAEEFRKKLHEG